MKMQCQLIIFSNNIKLQKNNQNNDEIIKDK